MAVENAPGAAPQPPGQPRPAAQPQPRPAAQPAAAQADAESGDAGLGDEMQALHNARTQVPGHEGVDARLDNRSGAARPPRVEWPAKPQQIDGPDVAGQAEFTRKFLQGREEPVGAVQGQYSPGPHGLSPESLRESDEPLYGTESLSESDLASGAKG